MKAQYRLGINNPFIAAMPEFMDKEMFYHRTMCEIKFKANVSIEERLREIETLSVFYEPLPFAFNIYQMIYSSMLSSYMNKNTVEAVKQLYALHERRETHLYETQAESYAILGYPGIGKTSAIQRIASLFPDIIEHERFEDIPLYRNQIPMITVTCPGDCSVKSLCREIIRTIQKRLDPEVDLTLSYASKGSSTDTLIGRIAALCMVHNVGVIVVDEIQFLKYSRTGRDRIISFLVALMNEVGVGIILVGTNEVDSLLQQQPHLMRRTRGLRLNRMNYGADFLSFAIKVLTAAGATNPSVDFLHTLFSVSDGTPALLVKAIKELCRRAVLEKKPINTELLVSVAKDYQFPNIQLLPETQRGSSKKKTFDLKTIPTTKRIGRPSGTRDKQDLLENAKTGEITEFLRREGMLYG